MKKLSFAAGACSTLLAGLVLFQVSACSTHSHSHMNALDEYREALTKVEAGETVSPGSDLEKRALAGVRGLLSEFSRENMEGRVTDVYADEVFFNDTLKTLRSAEEIEEYFLETADLLNASEVKFTDTARSGSDYYLRWEMSYESKKINKGNDIRTIGMTHLRFNPEGKVVVHQDFWDSTRGVFEHVPVIGSGIRIVKKRL